MKPETEAAISETTLSIIIVSWNTREILLDCLEHLCRGLVNIPGEIIVVDNHSSDGTPEAVAARFPEVKLVRNEGNLGFARANNIGLRMCRGRYIALVNSDILVRNGCLGRLIGFLEHHPATGMAGPRILNPDGTLQPSILGFPTPWRLFCRALSLDNAFPQSCLLGGQLMTYQPHNRIEQVEVLNGCFWMVRREAFSNVGLLDDRFFIYGEDIDWCRRFNLAGWKVTYFPGAEAVHYGGASSARSPLRFYLEKQRANLLYWRKHYGSAGVWYYNFMISIHEALRLAGHGLSCIVPSRRTEDLFKVRRSLACLGWLMRISVCHCERM